MAQVPRSNSKLKFNTGLKPTQQDFYDLHDSLRWYDEQPPDEGFGVLTSTTWDYSTGRKKTYSLMANTALTITNILNGQTAAILLVKQDLTGSRTLSINGTGLIINSAPSSSTLISIIHSGSGLVYSINNSIIVAAFSVPTLTSAVIQNSNTSQIVLTYSTTLNSAFVPATTDFTAYVGGSPATISSVSISTASVLINLAASVLGGVTVTLNYTPGTNKIQDGSGNLAAGFTSQTVTNNIIVPSVTSRATASTTTIAVTFNEGVTSTITGWSFKQNGSALTPSSISGSGTNTLTFTVPTMAGTDTLLCSYNAGTGNCKDSNNTPLNPFTDQSVTNNIGGSSTLTAPVLSVGSPTSTTIPLTWTDPNSSPNELNFELQGSPDNSTWSVISSSIAANTTSYTDSGLAPSTLKYYRIRALGNGSSILTSNWSNTVNQTTSAAVYLVPVGATGQTESPAHTYTYSGATNMTFDKSLPASTDGSLIFDVPDSTAETVPLGLDTNNTQNDRTAPWLFVFYREQGTNKLVSGENGSYHFDPVTDPVTSSHQVKVTRTAGTVKIWYSTDGGANFTLVRTLTTTTTAQLYPKAQIITGAGTGNKIVNLRETGMA